MPQIPLEDFFENPQFTGFKISPDGNYISWLQPWQKRLNLYVQKTEDRLASKPGAKRLSASEHRDILDYLWVDDEHLLFFQDFEGDENYHAYRVGLESEAIDLTPFEGVKVGFVDELHDFPGEVMIQLNKRNPQLFDLYRLNVATASLDLVAENPGHISQWIVDNQARVRSAYYNNGVQSGLLYRNSEDEEFQTVFETDFKNSLDPLFYDFDDQYLLALSNIDRDKLAAVRIDPRTAEEIELLYVNEQFDAAGIGRSHVRKILTAVQYTDWRVQRHFLDEKSADRFAKLQAQLGEDEIHVEARTQNEKELILKTLGDRNPGTFFYYNSEKDELKELGEAKPKLKREELSSVKPIQYTSRDGLQIHGYLTLPENYSAGKKIPMLINPHGGPWHRDIWRYNPELQFLANRGIGVLQMNFRGSLGYGKEFWKSSFKEWGKKMQDDVSDGVHWLIEQGIADPDRVGIYGGSYGGYCTLAGMTFTPELYCCGVDYVGVSNLFTFMDSFPPYWEPFREMMYEMVGHPEQDKEYLHSSSPVFHVDRIQAPVLVVQGARDPRVNQAESEQIVAALKDRGLDVAYLLKENEGHGFLLEENRFEFYRLMEEFLGKHLLQEQGAVTL
jgi:dipeptidyl aminopeptidase/acylaminoacyl peptidase